MALIQVSDRYLNTYDKAHEMLRNNVAYTDRDWEELARTGNLDLYIDAMSKIDQIEDYEKFAKEWQLEYATPQNKLLALDAEINKNTSKYTDIVKKDKYLFDEEGNYKKDEQGNFVTESYETNLYDYYKNLITEQNAYEKEKVIREQEKIDKLERNAFQNITADIISTGANAIAGALNQADAIRRFAEGAYKAYVYEPLYNWNIDLEKQNDTFVKELSKDTGWLSDFNNWIAEYERKFTDMRDVNGNLTSVGNIIDGISTSLGQMIPSIIGGKITGAAALKLGASAEGAALVSKATSSILFYEGVVADDVKRTYLELCQDGLGPSSSSILANSFVKAGVQWAVEEYLGKFLEFVGNKFNLGIGGASTLDKFVFGREQGKLITEGTKFGKRYLEKQALKRLGYDFVEEGLEEVIQDSTDYFINYIFGEFVHTNFGELNKEFNGQSLMDSFIIGGLTSVVGSGIEIVSNYIEGTIKDTIPRTDKLSKVFGTVQTDAQGNPIGKRLNPLSYWEYGNSLNSYYQNMDKLRNMLITSIKTKMPDAKSYSNILKGVFAGKSEFVKKENEEKLLTDLAKIVKNDYKDASFKDLFILNIIATRGYGTQIDEKLAEQLTTAYKEIYFATRVMTSYIGSIDESRVKYAEELLQKYDAFKIRCFRENADLVTETSDILTTMNDIQKTMEEKRTSELNKQYDEYLSKKEDKELKNNEKLINKELKKTDKNQNQASNKIKKEINRQVSEKTIKNDLDTEKSKTIDENNIKDNCKKFKQNVENATKKKVIVKESGSDVIVKEKEVQVPINMLELGDDVTITQIVHYQVNSIITEMRKKDKILDKTINELAEYYLIFKNNDKLNKNKEISTMFLDKNFMRQIFTSQNIKSYMETFNQFFSKLEKVKINNTTEKVEKLFNKQISTYKNNYKKALSEYLSYNIFVQIPTGLFDEAEIVKIKTLRNSQNIANTVVEKGAKNLTNEQAEFLSNKIKYLNMSNSDKKDLELRLNSENKEIRKSAINFISSKYDNMFNNNYDNVTYLKTDSLGNRVFNKYLQDTGYDLQNFFTLNSLSETEWKFLLEQKGLVPTVENKDSITFEDIVEYRRTQFSNNVDGIYDLVPSKRNIQGYTYYSVIVTSTESNVFANDYFVNEKISSNKQLDETYLEGKSKTKFLNKLSENKYIVGTSENSLYSLNILADNNEETTIDDVIMKPYLLNNETKNEIINKYGKLTNQTTYLYLREYIANVTGDTTVEVDRNNNFILVTMKTSEKILNNKEIELNDKTKISDILSKEVLDSSPMLKNMNISFVKGKSLASYDKDNNTLYLDKSTFQNKKLTNSYKGNYLKLVLLHEIQHAIQYENNLNLGFDGNWLYTVEKMENGQTFIDTMLEDVKKHAPYLISKKDKQGKSILRQGKYIFVNKDEQKQFLNNFVYNCSGEIAAEGYTGNESYNIYPVIIKDDGKSTKIIMPWGTIFNLGSRFKQEYNGGKQFLDNKNEDGTDNLGNMLFNLFMDKKNVNLDTLLDLETLTENELSTLQNMYNNVHTMENNKEVKKTLKQLLGTKYSDDIVESKLYATELKPSQYVMRMRQLQFLAFVKSYNETVNENQRVPLYLLDLEKIQRYSEKKGKYVTQNWFYTMNYDGKLPSEINVPNKLNYTFDSFVNTNFNTFSPPVEPQIETVNSEALTKEVKTDTSLNNKLGIPKMKIEEDMPKFDESKVKVLDNKVIKEKKKYPRKNKETRVSMKKVEGTIAVKNINRNLGENMRKLINSIASNEYNIDPYLKGTTKKRQSADNTVIKGTISTASINDYIKTGKYKDTSPKYQQQTFDAINKYIYKNPYIDSFKELDELVESNRNMYSLYNTINAFLNKARNENNEKMIKYYEDMLNNVKPSEFESYDDVITFAKLQGSSFYSKFINQWNSYDKVGEQIGQMRYDYMKLYDDTLKSTYLIGKKSLLKENVEQKNKVDTGEGDAEALMDRHVTDESIMSSLQLDIKRIIEKNEGMLSNDKTLNITSSYTAEKEKRIAEAINTIKSNKNITDKEIKDLADSIRNFDEDYSNEAIEKTSDGKYISLYDKVVNMSNKEFESYMNNLEQEGYDGTNIRALYNEFLKLANEKTKSDITYITQNGNIVPKTSREVKNQIDSLEHNINQKLSKLKKEERTLFIDNIKSQYGDLITVKDDKIYANETSIKNIDNDGKEVLKVVTDLIKVHENMLEISNSLNQQYSGKKTEIAIKDARIRSLQRQLQRKEEELKDTKNKLNEIKKLKKDTGNENLKEVKVANIIIGASDVKIPEKLKTLLNTEFTENVPSTTKYFAADGEEHRKISMKTFQEQNSETLGSLTVTDVIEIANFVKNFHLLQYESADEKLMMFNALLGTSAYIFRCYKEGLWHTDTSEDAEALSDAINTISHFVSNDLSRNAGTELKLISEAEKYVHPEERFRQEYVRANKIFKDKELEPLFNDLYNATIKFEMLQEATADEKLSEKERSLLMRASLNNINEKKEALYQKALEKQREQKGQTNLWEKIYMFEHTMMLSSPRSWVRNWTTNMLLTAANRTSGQLGYGTIKVINSINNTFRKIFGLETKQNIYDKIKNETVVARTKIERIKTDKGEIEVQTPVIESKYGQYNIFNTKPSKESLEFIKTYILDSGFYSMIENGISNKYNLTEFFTDKNSSKSKADFIAKAVQMDIMNRLSMETKQYGKTLQKVYDGIFKMMSDSKFVTDSMIYYLSRILTEAKIDLTKGLTNTVINAMTTAYIQASQDYMHKTNFANDLERTLAQNNMVAYYGFKQVFPFAPSSINWFVEGLNFTPFGLMKATTRLLNFEKFIQKQEQLRFKTKKGISVDVYARGTELYNVTRNIGKGMIGSFTSLIAALLVASGRIKVDDEDDKPKLKFGDNFYIKIGDDDLGTGFMFGAVSALAIKEYAERQDKNVFDTLLNAIVKGGEELFKADVISNVESIFRNILQGETEMKFAKTLDTVLGMYVPAFWKFVVNITNTDKIDYTTGIYGQAQKALYKKIIPFINNDFLNSAYIDPYTGEHQVKYFANNNLGRIGTAMINAINQLSPIQFYPYHMSKYEKEAVSVGVSKTSLTGRYNINDEKVYLNTADRRKLNEYYSELNKNTLPDLFENKKKFKIQNKDTKQYEYKYYKDMDDKQKATIIERLMSDNGSYSKIYYLTSTDKYKYYTNKSEYATLRKLGITKNVYISNKKNEGFVKIN